MSGGPSRQLTRKKLSADVRKRLRNSYGKNAVILFGDGNIVDKCMQTMIEVSGRLASGDGSEKDIKLVLVVPKADEKEYILHDSYPNPRQEGENAEVITLEEVVNDYSLMQPPAEAVDADACKFKQGGFQNTKRIKGARGYYQKTLGVFASYWNQVRKFNDILYMDCGMHLSDGRRNPVLEVFKHFGQL